MKMNLFSSFNPITSQMTSLMWITMIMILALNPAKMWALESKSLMMKSKMTMNIHSQLKNMTKKSSSINLSMTMTLMLTILMMNISGLFPFIYAYTSQPQVTMSMAIPMWTAIMAMKMKTPDKLMSHMLPQSTPTPLMIPMILIETTSTLIQPITLSIRLMANITAGHILMTLLSSSYSSPWTAMTMLVQMSFTMMEMFVSLIQAYVFAMLMTMYMK